MQLIVACDAQQGIGYKNQLLYHIPEDMARFKQLTTGNSIVMGRRTLESLPKGKPLPNRENIILTHQQGYAIENGIVVHSVEELFQYIREKHIPQERVFVIGGGEVYKLLLPFCDGIYLTEIVADMPKQADTFLPSLSAFEIAECTAWKKFDEGKYRFVKLASGK